MVTNWQREAATFTPSLRVVVVGDSEAKRTRGRGLGDHRPLAELVADADLVVTSYALLLDSVSPATREAYRTLTGQ